MRNKLTDLFMTEVKLMSKIFYLFAVLSFTLLFSFGVCAEQSQAQESEPDLGWVQREWLTVNIETELRALAKQHGLKIRGIDKTADLEALVTNEELLPTLKRLLKDFNYMQEFDDNGKLALIRIIGVKGAPSARPSSTVVPTENEGGRHRVKVGLKGTDGVNHEVMLLVDTGANVVVLEEAMIDILHLDKATLNKQVVKTANGMTEALKGKIPSVQIKSETVEMVDVAFLPREKLSGEQLLGMSLLGKFKITLDDLNDEMTLTPN